MNKYIWGIVCVFAILLGVSSCSDDDEIPVVTPSASGTMADKDGNEYRWVRIGKLDWMAENLHCDAPFYDDWENEKYGDRSLSWTGTREEAIEHYKRFGNYYSWQEAMDKAPEGWRLPTDEDWKKLELALGMSSKVVDNEGWRKGASYLMAQSDEGTCLGLRYGGQVTYYSWQMGILHDYDFGYYWTGTRADINGEPASYARSFTPGQNAVNRIKVLHEEHYLSVRYVRDAE